MRRRLLRGGGKELSRLVDVQDLRALDHAHDRGLDGSGCDDEPRAERRDAILERLGRHRDRAGNQDRADLQAGERDLEPLDGHPHEHEDAIARSDAAFAEEPGPPRALLGQLEEGARLDDTVLSECHHRLSLGIESERFDDVPREVEAIRDLPASLLERGIERELEGR